MIDPHSGVPAWRQLADDLRVRIASGEWPPGGLLPSRPRLMHEYGVGRSTVQSAMIALRTDGLIDFEHGIGIRVREVPEEELVKVPRGARVRTRMPTPEERAELGIPSGVPVLVVAFGGRERILSGDKTTLTIA